VETVSQSLLGILVSVLLSGCLIHTPPGVPYTPPPDTTTAEDAARLMVPWTPPAASESLPNADTPIVIEPSMLALDVRPRRDGLSRTAGRDLLPSKLNAAVGQRGERRREGPIC
jgi:hypothetical protein